MSFAMDVFPPQTAGDLEKIVQWATRFYAESGYKGQSNADQLRSTLRSLAENDVGCVLMHGHGFIAGMIVKSWYDDAVIATELAWWAEKGGLILLSAFEKWAVEKGANRLTMGVIERGLANDERVKALYQRRGYAPKETAYVKEI